MSRDVDSPLVVVGCSGTFIECNALKAELVEQL